MAGTTCTICLDDVKSPVSIPCGHLHCEACLVQYVEQHDEVAEAPCPTCRAMFCVATPDLRFVPQKYHKYLLPTVRRVYLSQAQPRGTQHLKDVISALENRTEVLENQNTTYRSRVLLLEKRVSGLVADKERLMDRCEAHMASAKRFQEKEREARMGQEESKREYESLKRKYADIKAKYKALKHSKTPAPPPPPPGARATKRTSAQAALDFKQEETRGTARLILPIPKRPRMAFGWRPTIGEMTDGEDDKSKLKVEPETDVEADHENDQEPFACLKKEEQRDDFTVSPFSCSSVASPFPQVKREQADARLPHDRSHRSSRRQPTTLSYGIRDDEEDERALQNLLRERPPISSLLHGQQQKSQKLKASGLSMFLQKMEVDEDESSLSSPLGADSSPVAGPSSRPAGGRLRKPVFKPTRSGLASGDVFSPRRGDGGHGSLDYSSSPMRMADLDYEDTDDVKPWARDRTFVFRGKKVTQATPEA